MDILTLYTIIGYIAAGTLVGFTIYAEWLDSWPMRQRIGKRISRHMVRYLAVHGVRHRESNRRVIASLPMMGIGSD